MSVTQNILATKWTIGIEFPIEEILPPLPRPDRFSGATRFLSNEH